MKIVTWIFIGSLAVGLPGQVCAEGEDQTSQTTLYEKWQATNHTDYVTAYASAKAYVSKYPGGPNAKELIIWLRAFERVSKELGSQSASTPPRAPSGPTPSTPPQLAPNAPGATAVAPSPPPDPAEIVFWQTIASSTTVADFEEYLRQYPQGRFAGLAHNRIAALTKPPVAEFQPAGAFRR